MKYVMKNKVKVEGASRLKEDDELGDRIRGRQETDRRRRRRRVRRWSSCKNKKDKGLEGLRIGSRRGAARRRRRWRRVIKWKNREDKDDEELEDRGVGKRQGGGGRKGGG